MNLPLANLPLVNSCSADACSYNTDHNCHAQAITVGETEHAQCDTYVRVPAQGGDPVATGHVGACKMSDCQHNVRLECQAPGIAVGYVENQVDCLTYTPA